MRRRELQVQCPTRVQGHGKLTVPYSIQAGYSFTCGADRQSPFPALPATRIPRAFLHNPRHRARRLRHTLHRRACRFLLQSRIVPLPGGTPSRNEGTRPTPARGVPLSSLDDPRIPVDPPFFFLAAPGAAQSFLLLSVFDTILGIW